MTMSDTQCRSAKASSKPYKLFDGEGLYLHVMPSGAKYWRLKYRFRGRERKLALGHYPTVSLQDARKQKDVYKADLNKGLDPAFIKLEQEQAAIAALSNTFEDIAFEWHAINVPAWQPRYAQTIKHRLEKYVFPDFGTYPITLLKPPIILNALRRIEETAPEMARRIKQLCSHICRYAIAMGKIEVDPTIGLETALKKYKKTNFASIDVDEVPDFIHALQEHKARLYRQTYLAIKLMFLTFVRTSELIEAKWVEIDFENALWTIPAERMKMKKSHLVPLSKQALAVLNELNQANGKREHVFPSIPRPRKPMSKGSILVALKRMKYTNRMTGHGFRSLAMGILKEKLGYSHEIVDRQLAHAPKSSVDRAYDRAKFLPQRIEMMQRYGDYLDEIGTKSKKSVI